MAFCRVFAATLIAMFLGHAAPAHAQDECLTFSSFENTISNQIGARFESLMASVNICAKVIYLPFAQSEQMFLSGKIDGELLRVADYGDYEALGKLRVPIPSVEGEGLLVSKDPSLQSIRQLDGRLLGIVRGITWQETAAQDYDNIVVLPSYDIMVQMLNAGRVDAILIDNHSLRRLGEAARDLARAVIVYRNVYVWVQPDHRDLVPEIAKAIETYRAEGKLLFDPLN